jgi:rsbT co-antagonist protein RsbR
MLISNLPSLFGTSDADFLRIKRFGKMFLPKVPELVASLHAYIKNSISTEQYERIFPNDPLIQHVKDSFIRSWTIFFTSIWDDAHTDHLRRIGTIHAKVGIDPGVYLATVNKAMELLSEEVAGSTLDHNEMAATITSIRRVLMMEAVFINHIYAERIEEVLKHQSRSIIEMSTPISVIWNGVLLLPLVGILDSARAESVTEKILLGVRDSNASAVIIDISGVSSVDTEVAGHIMNMSKATRLMGCELMVAGISPKVAQTIVSLGVDVGIMRTTATLRDALAFGLKTAGMEISQIVSVQR